MNINKLVGDFGVYATALLLEKHYQDTDFNLTLVNDNDPDYDLEISESYPQTYFEKPSVINVNTRKTSTGFLTTEPTLETVNNHLYEQEHEFWISFVNYQFRNDMIGFSTHIINGKDLDPQSDYKEVTRDDGRIKEILTENLKRKAPLSFHSTDLDRMEN